MQRNRYNIIIDTNVIISALATSQETSPVCEVMNLFYHNKIIVYYSDDIIDEYKRVLSRKEFNLNKSYIGDFINNFKKKAKHINPKKIEETLIDNTDIPFYALVLDKRVFDARLITGNIKHYPKKNYILTASDFIKKVYKN